MSGVMARVRSFCAGLLRRNRLDRDMDDEMRFHVEMETERIMRRHGLGRDAARRQALTMFGSAERYKGQGRDARGITRFIDFSLDVKLGVRTLRKYPVVSAVGGLAIAIGVGLGAAYLEIVNDFLHPRLPFHEGDRIVGVQFWDRERNEPELQTMSYFVAWRDGLRSIADIAAFRAVERNVGLPNMPAEPAQGAEIAASAFRVTRVPALLGRTLIDADESPGAPPAIVLGYQLWRTRFAADPAIVGRVIQLGNSTSTVAGVMPEGFAFPINHQFWVPLPRTAATYEAGQGPPIQIFGRLAPEATTEEAQAEISASAGDRLRPRVVKYTELFVGGSGNTDVYMVEFAFVLLLVVLCSNVATMVFARTATRENEIAMRFALGSTRRRILVQFFLEALVLALAATAVGLMTVAWGTSWVMSLMWQIADGQVPFWLDGRLNVTTVLYAIALAIVASLVAGVVPALKATNSHVQARVRHAAGAGDSGLRFGGFWSAVIVVQVAFAVLVVPPAIVSLSAFAAADRADPGFAPAEYLSARLELETSDREFASTCEELRRRLLANPQIDRVAFANRLPGMNHPEPGIQIEGETAAADSSVMPAAVDAEYFRTFGAEMIAGRGFTPGDATARPGVIVVNEAFVSDILRGRNAIGRRVRYQTRYGEEAANGADPGSTQAEGLQRSEWYEIVGVVRNLGMDTNRDPLHPGTGPGIYHPLTTSAVRTGARTGAVGDLIVEIPVAAGVPSSVRLVLHARGEAAALIPQLREAAHAVHPGLRLYDVLPLDEPLNKVGQLTSRFFTSVTALVAFISLLISAAGTYSVLSFTVARQTRDIGIRIALGADRRRVVTGVFSRAMLQIAAGVLAGAALWTYFIVFELARSEESAGRQVRLLLSAAAVLMMVGIAACGVPVRRALRIQPTEALRDVG